MLPLDNVLDNVKRGRHGGALQARSRSAEDLLHHAHRFSSNKGMKSQHHVADVCGL